MLIGLSAKRIHQNLPWLDLAYVQSCGVEEVVVNLFLCIFFAQAWIRAEPSFFISAFQFSCYIVMEAIE